MARGKTNPNPTGRNSAASGSAGSDGGEERHEVSNLGARKELIQKAFRDLAGLDSKIKGLREEKAEIVNKVVKGDLGMNSSDFAIARRLYALEGPDRDALLDACREIFDAMGVGEQLDIFKVQERMARHAPAHEDDMGEPRDGVPGGNGVAQFG